MEHYAFDLVGLGGCFDHLHQGHKKLLSTAFRMGQHVAIALTTEALQQNKAFRSRIQAYNIRKKGLEDYISTELKRPPEDFSIIPLNDPFGPAITDPRLQAHVSSMETYRIALKINEIRIANHLNPLTIIIIPLLRNEEGQKISSSHFRRINDENNAS